MDKPDGAAAVETASAIPHVRSQRCDVKPCPADFAAVAAIHTTLTLQRHYSAGSSTIRRWLKESGGKTRPRGGVNARRGPPADFAAVAPGKTIPQIQEIYRCSDSMVSRWRKACGIITPSTVRRPIPADFAEHAAYHSLRELAARYGVSRDTITRWGENGGIRLKGRPLASKAAPSISKAGAPRTPPIPAISGDAASLAAQHLRRFFPNVYPAAILGPKERKSLPGKGEGMWVVAGRGAIPADQMIALAETKGFDQRAWAAI